MILSTNQMDHPPVPMEQIVGPLRDSQNKLTEPEENASKSAGSETESTEEEIESPTPRYFKLVNPTTGESVVAKAPKTGSATESEGRYVGRTPRQAAMKAFTAIAQMSRREGTDATETNIYLTEATRGSANKTYGYAAVRTKIPELKERKLDSDSGDSDDDDDETPKILHYKNKIIKPPTKSDVDSKSSSSDSEEIKCEPIVRKPALKVRSGETYDDAYKKYLEESDTNANSSEKVESKPVAKPKRVPPRYFKLINPTTGECEGRYTGQTPKQAASKAFTKLIQRGTAQSGVKTDIFIRESTRGCVPKTYGYAAQRTKLANPHELQIADAITGETKTIVMHFRNQIMKTNVPSFLQCGSVDRKDLAMKEESDSSSSSSSEEPSPKKSPHQLLSRQPPNGNVRDGPLRQGEIERDASPIFKSYDTTFNISYSTEQKIKKYQTDILPTYCDFGTYQMLNPQTGKVLGIYTGTYPSNKLLVAGNNITLVTLQFEPIVAVAPRAPPYRVEPDIALDKICVCDGIFEHPMFRSYKIFDPQSGKACGIYQGMLPELQIELLGDINLVIFELGDQDDSESKSDSETGSNSESGTD